MKTSAGELLALVVAYKLLPTASPRIAAVWVSLLTMVGVRGQYRLGASAQKHAWHIDPCSSFKTGEMSSGEAFEWRQQVHSLLVRNAGGRRFSVVAQGGPVSVRIARHAASRQATAAYALHGRPENRRFSIYVPEKLVPNVRTVIQNGRQLGG
jgi:hypothetical protein